ncbi:MAG TPA: amino acid permease, partial [Myxococcales bacterium]|nr:amino acid permease [Myxococcales bacterium]
MDPGPEPAEQAPALDRGRLRRLVLGKPKNVEDPQLFHTLTLAAFLAWVGLGADGLSSSAYGPEEAFKNLGEHQYLAVFLALLTGFTVVIIAAAYSKIIEHFPFGGGGYVVATRLLGPKFGLISGSALLVDYVLTISVSIASGADAAFSSLPAGTHWLKLPVAFAVIVLLTLMNLRGVKESVRTLVPVFLTFLVTHIVIIGGSVLFHLGRAGEVAHEVTSGLSHDLRTLGFVALSA